MLLYILDSIYKSRLGKIQIPNSESLSHGFLAKAQVVQHEFL